MTEAQTWTMISAFIALMFGMLTVVSTLFIHVLRTEIRSLDTKFDARFGGLSAHIDGLDRDMRALVKHTFGIDRG